MVREMEGFADTLYTIDVEPKVALLRLNELKSTAFVWGKYGTFSMALQKALEV